MITFAFNRDPILHTRPTATLLAACLCVVTAGCGGNTEVSTPPPTPPASAVDEAVLRSLDYYEPMYKVDGEGRVTHLRMIWRHLTVPVLAEIGKLTELQSIDFAGTTITDEGLTQLKDLQKLRGFGLGSTQITDKGLPHLEKLQSLEWLWMTKKNFSEEAIDKLKSARPDLNVYLH